MLVRSVVVQCLASHEFLCPSPDGDVTTTPLLSKAGHFYDIDEAVSTAEFFGLEPHKFEVFPFFIDVMTKATKRH